MKKLILIPIIVLLFAVEALAIGPATLMMFGGDCIPDCSGLTDCQNFEGTGYDNSEAWTTTTAGSGAIDEDAATPGAGSPSKWCFQALKSTTTAAAETAYIHNDADLGDAAISYFRIDFVLASHSLANTEENSIFHVANNAWDHLIRANIYNNGGTLELRISSYHDDLLNSYTALTAISLNTRYRLEIKWDTTNNLWAWRLNDVDQPNNTDGTDPVESEGALASNRGSDEVSIGQTVAANAAVLYFDRYGVHPTAWIGNQ